jgi:hypothetical protein
VPFFEGIFKVNLELFTEVPCGAAHISSDDIFVAQLVIKDSRHAVFRSVLNKTRRVSVINVKIAYNFCFSLN